MAITHDKSTSPDQTQAPRFERADAPGDPLGAAWLSKENKCMLSGEIALPALMTRAFMALRMAMPTQY
ncbi:MAG: hypothetical protein EBQ82_06305 [Betaproteobacteria bacterium]|nr:hypothetical protein [Betaproteobacteria bacterium]